LKWKTAEIFRALRMFCFYGFLGTGASERRSMMYRGIYHGWKGIDGPMKLPQA
jgi:hypothetical protein